MSERTRPHPEPDVPVDHRLRSVVWRCIIAGLCVFWAIVTYTVWRVL